jgi:hypothetical protein
MILYLALLNLSRFGYSLCYPATPLSAQYFEITRHLNQLTTSRAHHNDSFAALGPMRNNILMTRIVVALKVSSGVAVLGS